MGRVNSRSDRRATKALRVGLAIVVVSIVALPLSGPAKAQVAESPAFRFVGRVPVDFPRGSNSEGSMLLDPVHRRGYVVERFTQGGQFMKFHRYDLDEVENGELKELMPPITAAEQTHFGIGGSQAQEAGEEKVMAIDPAGNRILYWDQAGGTIYEVKTDDPDPLDPTVHAWMAAKPGTAVDSRQALIFNQMTITGMSYDAGTPGPPRVYVSAEAGNANSGVLTERQKQGVVLMGWDARPGADDNTFQNPEGRLLWTYVARSCVNQGRGGEGQPTKIQSPVFRAGDWLYTFCDARGDLTAQGMLRVKLVGANREPDPNTEQFFPGVAGNSVHVNADIGSERAYVASQAGIARNILVFDGRANEGRGTYIGAIALTQSHEVSLEGIDPTTGRWYIQTIGGLWFQDGRLRRVAQANRFTTAVTPSGGKMTLEGFGGTAKTIGVDPAVPGVRGARIFVPRSSSSGRCGGDRPCLEIFEDLAPLPPDLPPGDPDEVNKTLNVPEADGLTGNYSALASAYGVRLRVMRGLSTFWQGNTPSGALLETPPQNNPPTAPGDYVTDPLFNYGGECGANDREVTFGRVRQTQVKGDLFNREAVSVAVPVDPDVVRPSTPDDVQTRTDVEAPDQCVIGLMRTMSNPMPGADQFPWESAGQPLAAMGQDWPYETIGCDGDGEPASASGSFSGLAPAQAEVRCAATANEPTADATTHTQLSPTAFPVTVEETETSTKTIRPPGQGIETRVTSVVKGIVVAGVVEIEEMVVTATSKAKGYRAAQGTTASVETTREFSGMSVGGQRQCGHCDPEQVVAAINLALGSTGYARAADPEPDWAQGTTLGTKAVVQKDLLLQDSDAVLNHDYSTEWPGLEIVIYRDGTYRGRGRWEVQLGGVFSQAEFAVVKALPPVEDDGGTPSGDGGGPTSATPPVVAGGSEVPGTAAIPGERVAVEVGAVEPTGPQGEAVGTQADGPIQRLIRGFERTLKGAILLLAVWALIYAPVYLARRRQFLREVMGEA